MFSQLHKPHTPKERLTKETQQSPLQCDTFRKGLHCTSVSKEMGFSNNEKTKDV